MIPHRIEPNAKPGGVVFVHYLETGDVLLRQETAIDDGLVAVSAAAYASDVVQAQVDAGHIVTLHVYDGDTGELMGAAIADADGRRHLP